MVDVDSNHDVNCKSTEIQKGLHMQGFILLLLYKQALYIFQI